MHNLPLTLGTSPIHWEREEWRVRIQAGRPSSSFFLASLSSVWELYARSSSSSSACNNTHLWVSNSCMIARLEETCPHFRRPNLWRNKLHVYYINCTGHLISIRKGCRVAAVCKSLLPWWKWWICLIDTSYSWCSWPHYTSRHFLMSQSFTF